MGGLCAVTVLSHRNVDTYMKCFLRIRELAGYGIRGPIGQKSHKTPPRGAESEYVRGREYCLRFAN